VALTTAYIIPIYWYAICGPRAESGS